MTNYLLITGCFEGEIVGEKQILDVLYSDLDTDLQKWIQDYVKDATSMDGFEFLTPDDLKEAYEDSWQFKETDKPVTLKPVSEQIA